MRQSIFASCVDKRESCFEKRERLSPRFATWEQEYEMQSKESGLFLNYGKSILGMKFL